MRNFKLIVKETGGPTIAVLQYFDKNIREINRMQVFLVIVKMKEEDLDKDLVGKLAAKGITRFPALITDNGRVFLGVQKIRDLFDKNLQSYRKQDIAAAPKQGPTAETAGNTEYGTNPDLASYWKTLLNGKDQEDEDINENRKDIERRMREYNPPKQRQKTNGKDLDNDPRLCQLKSGGDRRGSQKPSQRAVPSPEDDENIQIDPVGQNVVDMLSSVEHEERNAEDDRMERAMWENKVSGAFSPD